MDGQTRAGIAAGAQPSSLPGVTVGQLSAWRRKPELWVKSPGACTEHFYVSSRKENM